LQRIFSVDVLHQAENEARFRQRLLEEPGRWEYRLSAARVWQLFGPMFEHV